MKRALLKNEVGKMNLSKCLKIRKNQRMLYRGGNIYT